MKAAANQGHVCPPDSQGKPTDGAALGGCRTPERCAVPPDGAAMTDAEATVSIARGWSAAIARAETDVALHALAAGRIGTARKAIRSALKHYAEAAHPRTIWKPVGTNGLELVAVWPGVWEGGKRSGEPSGTVPTVRGANDHAAPGRS